METMKLGESEKNPKTKLDIELKESKRGQKYEGQLNFDGRKFNYTIGLTVSIDDIINNKNIDRNRLEKIFPITCTESSGESINLDPAEHGYLLAILLPSILDLYHNPQAAALEDSLTNVLSPALFAHRDRDIITGPIVSGLSISDNVYTASVPKKFLTTS